MMNNIIIYMMKNYISYGNLEGNTKIYALVVEKCQEDTLHVLFGNDTQCKSDSDIKNSIEYGIWMNLVFYDNYINLLDYKNPNNSYIYYLENSLNNNYLSINNLHFSPVTFNSDNGLIFEHTTTQYLYEFETNDLSIQNNNMDDDIYLSYNIKFNNKMSFYERTYSKLLHIFSDIGGIIEIISFIAELIVKYYNEYIVLRHTKKIIYHLHNKPNIEKSENNQNGEFCSEIDLKRDKIKENNEEKNNIVKKPENKDISIQNMNDDAKDNKNIFKSNITIINVKGDKEDKGEKLDKENDDDKIIFNEENQDFNLFSFLLYKLTFEKTFTKYKIYSDFRDKILCDEQIIKNHISLYNLKQNNNLTSQIFSLKEIINND